MLGYDSGGQQMLRVQNFDLWHCFLVHKDWKPGQPIELLPMLRACYPGCLNDNVLSVQLGRAHGDDMDTDWMLQVIRPKNDVYRCSVLPISEEHTEINGSDNYGFSDHPWDIFPDDLIQEILLSNRVEQWQKTFGIFKPEMFELMYRQYRHAEGRPGETLLGPRSGNQQLLLARNFVWFDYLLSNNWEPGQPIELLPALLAIYPGCLNDNVLSVQLRGEQPHGGKHDTDWMLQIVRPMNDVLQHPMRYTRNGNSGDYDFSSIQWDMFPDRLIDVVISEYHIEQWQQIFGLFKPEMFDLLLRHRHDAADDADHKVRESSNERANFLHETVELLSRQLAGQIDLEQQTIQRLKGESAFGLRAEENESRWIEIGAEAFQPSGMLYETTRSQVADVVQECFHDLPRATQVAIWFSHVSEMFPGGDEIDRWDVPRGSVHDMRLFDVHEVFDSVANSVLSAAGEEYGNAVMDGLR